MQLYELKHCQVVRYMRHKLLVKWNLFSIQFQSLYISIYYFDSLGYEKLISVCLINFISNGKSTNLKRQEYATAYPLMCNGTFLK